MIVKKDTEEKLFLLKNFCIQQFQDHLEYRVQNIESSPYLENIDEIWQ